MVCTWFYHLKTCHLLRRRKRRGGGGDPDDADAEMDRMLEARARRHLAQLRQQCRSRRGSFD